MVPFAGRLVKRLFDGKYFFVAGGIFFFGGLVVVGVVGGVAARMGEGIKFRFVCFCVL